MFPLGADLFYLFCKDPRDAGVQHVAFAVKDLLSNVRERSTGRIETE